MKNCESMNLDYIFNDMEILVGRMNRLEAEVKLSSQEIVSLRNYIDKQSKAPPIQKSGNMVDKSKIISFIDGKVNSIKKTRNLWVNGTADSLLLAFDEVKKFLEEVEG